MGKELFTIGHPLLVRVLIPMTAPPGPLASSQGMASHSEAASEISA